MTDQPDDQVLEEQSPGSSQGQPDAQGEPQQDAAAPADRRPGGPAEDHGPSRSGTPFEDDPSEPDGATEDALAEARRAATELTADLQRLQAEYLNYKRRVERDRQLVRENATFQVLSEMMPVLDSIDRAREHGELEPGLKVVADSLEAIVAKLGLTKYGESGDEFDPNVHEALMHGHSPDVTTTTVDVVAQSGYRIGDRVLRAAKVTVLDPE